MAVSFRSTIGAAGARIYPGLDDRMFNRARDKAMPSSRSPRGGFTVPTFRERDAHVIVVPPEGPSFPSWGAGTRNLYYEAAQSLREMHGAEYVSVLDVEPGEKPESWHRRLLALVAEVDATHVLTHIESDPGTPDRWTWDELWVRLAQSWDGVLLGVMFDSAFSSISMQSRRLARMSPNFVVVDICMPMDEQMVRGRPEVGPVNMPVSLESLALLDERLDGVEKTVDVSFIGALYPYRVDMLDDLRSQGLSVSVNPHRTDPTHDFHSSRRDQPSWLDYMAGLASSRMTINFSRSSAGPFEQLKTRVIESALAGTILLTDDKDRTRLFFDEEEDYAYFASVADIPQLVTTWTTGRDLPSIESRLKVRGRELALTDFWTGINRVLTKRRLPVLDPR
jgi:hypothetical protein